MSFEWLDSTPRRTDSTDKRAQVAAAELANRAGTMFRLGYTQADCAKRLCDRIAWEFDQPSKYSNYTRPDSLSDDAITKIVSDTYARRPGG